MNGPESLNFKAHVGEELKSQLGLRAANVVGAARGWVEKGVFIDAVDRDVVSAAMAFMESPTENLAEIKKQAEIISQVLCGYMMQGEDTPPELDAVYNYLMTLQGANQISFIEAKLEEGVDVNTAEIQEPLTEVLGWAKVIARDCKDDTLLKAVNVLDGEMDSL